MMKDLIFGDKFILSKIRLILRLCLRRSALLTFLLLYESRRTPFKHLLYFSIRFSNIAILSGFSGDCLYPEFSINSFLILLKLSKEYTPLDGDSNDLVAIIINEAE